jgi:predicted PhzF superfamily epimerase YddE/YHI9
VSEVRLRTVDAFTQTPFTGNPAAIVMLDDAPPDDWMAEVARETNLSDTGFVIRESSSEADFRLRWFTPTTEVDLCGHATLASAHCLFEDGVDSPIRFATRSGVLTDLLAPAAEALGTPVSWTGRTDGNFFLLAVVADESSVRDLIPNLDAIAQLDASAVIATAQADSGRPYDFVSRLFAPKVGIDEDPVTGSSHTVLAPYWATLLGRTSMVGLQASPRPGQVGVELKGDRVIVTGHAVTVFDGVLRPTASSNS